MIVDITIIAAKAFLVLFMVLNLAGILGWIERKWIERQGAKGAQ